MTTRHDYYARPERFVGTTVVEIPVPSGKLIAADNLSSTPYFKVDPESSINYGAGLDEWTRLKAERAQIAQAFVGNTCPSVTRQEDGSLVVVSFAWDEATDEKTLVDDETVVAWICTDLSSLI